MDEGQPTTGDADGPVPRVARPAGAHRLTGEDTQILPRAPRLSGRRLYLLILLILSCAVMALGVGLAFVGRGGSPPAADQTGNAAGAGAGAAGPPVGDDPTGTVPTGASASGTPSRPPTPSASRAPGARSGTPAAPAAGASPAASPASSPAASPSASTVWTTLTVTATRALFRGQSMQTNRTTLVMQSDGNLAIVDETGTTRWRAGTSPNGDQAVFQGDGNFVVYDTAMRALWSSRTDGHPGAVLVLRADGNVCVVYQGARLWCAGTAH